MRLLHFFTVLFVVGGAGDAWAAAVCSNTPGEDDRVECSEDSTSTDDVDINLNDVEITVQESFIHGIHATHAGNGDIGIKLRDGQITTGITGNNPYRTTDGVRAWHTGDGHIDIELEGSEIIAQGHESHGIHAIQGALDGDGEGRISIKLRRSRIATGDPYVVTSHTTHGIHALHNNDNGDGRIYIELENSQITTDFTASHGIYALHDGDGDGRIHIRHDGYIATGRPTSHGIYAKHAGQGSSDIYIEILGGTIQLENGEITTKGIRTKGLSSHGVYAEHVGAGDGMIGISHQGRITTEGVGSHGILGFRSGTGAGDILMDIRGAEVSAAGRGAHGIYGYRYGTGTGDIRVNVRDSTLATAGDSAYGIWGFRNGAGTGDVRVDVRGGRLATGGNEAYGIIGFRSGAGTGDIDIALVGGRTTTDGYLSHGVYGFHRGSTDPEDGAALGDITIQTENHIVETTGTALDTSVPADTGTFSYGIYARHENAGNILIDIGKGSYITTKGAKSHGVVAYHLGAADTRRIAVTVGGPVTVSGEGAQGIRVGAVEDGNVVRAAAFGPDGYRMQVVTVDSAVSSDAEGVFLAGGGRVIIGTQGSIDSGSGIAILAAGDTPGTSPGDPAVKPKLRVDLNLDGRRVVRALGDNRIVNDGGETTIVVNGIVLHDGAAGLTGRTARNGVWDIRMPAAGAIGSSGVRSSAFVEEYAARAALYEALPDFLLGLQAGGLFSHRFPASSRAWIRTAGSTRSREFARSTVGASYDAERFALEAGWAVLQDESWDVQASIHRVAASSDVSSPVKGGGINAAGTGLSMDARWRSEDDYYLAGGLSWTGYDLGIASDTAGRLVSSADADVRSLHVEAGRRMQWGARLHWTPRIRLDHAGIGVDSFTDAVGARASFPDVGRYSGALGLTADTTRGAFGGELSMQGSVDIERRFAGADTSSWISGEKLDAESGEDDILLALGAAWSHGPWTLDAALSARETTGSGGHEHSASLNFGVRF